MNNIEDYFCKLRFDADHHLGLGDIRLTIAMQEELIAMYNKEVKDKEKLSELLTYASRLLHRYLPTEDSLTDYYKEELEMRKIRGGK